MTQRPVTQQDLEAFCALAQSLQQTGDFSAKIVVNNVGPKYTRINRQDVYKGVPRENSGSVYVFIENATGNIFKAAGYKTPAKGVRGNIFKAAGGRSAITQYGAVYNR